MKYIQFLVLSLILTFASCSSNENDLFKTTITITAGKLLSKFSTAQLDTITTLKLKGTIDARDFRIMRDSMPKLSSVDLSETSVVSYTGSEGTIGMSPKIYTYNANCIPESSFCKLEMILTGKTSLTEVKLPMNIDTIGAYSFALSSNLKSLIIPSSVKCIFYEALYESTCTITVDEDNQYFSSKDGVLFTKDLSVLIYYPGYKVGNYIVPESVKSIGTNAFAGCKNLTSITLPSNLNYIGSFSFSNCIGLKSINFPTSLLNIMYYAFSGCAGLTSITAPSTTQVFSGAFSNCTGLLTATYPNVPISETSIFAGCTSLTSVTFPPATTIIKASSFKDCTGLISIDIPSGIQTIENSSFENCKNLTTLKIPTTIEQIMSRAFYGCINLSAIYSFKNGPSTYFFNYWDEFRGVNANTCILYVPAGSRESYLSYTSIIFKNIVEM